MSHLYIEQSFKLVVFILLCINILSCTGTFDNGKNRSKRALPLLFTNTSEIAFIWGFGIPVNDLHQELVTVGMVLRATHNLPSTYQDLKQQTSYPINIRSSRKYDYSKNKNSSGKRSIFQQHRNTLSKYRVYFYKALEQLSISLGEKGRTCVLKMICEVSTVPFHHENGLLGELIHIIFTPSMSLDSYTKPQDHDYMEAEKIGKNGSSCEEVFYNCNKSILDLITNQLD